MTAFDNYVNKIIKDEIKILIEQQEYFLETDFCTMICERYNFAIYTVRGKLRRIYPEMSLVKRRLSGQLKSFYGLDVKGCPIIYIPDTHTGNC